MVWQRYDGSSHDIFFRKSTDGGVTWSTSPAEIASNVGGNSIPPLPVIISSASDKLTVIYRTSTNLGSRISTNDGSSWASGSVPSTNSNDNSPTLAFNNTYFGGGSRSCLVYPRTPGTIYYRYYIHGPDSTVGWSSAAKSLSQIVPGTYTGHKNPSLAKKGNSSAGLHVAWEAISSANNVIIHRKATDWYNWPSVYSVTYYQQQAQPSITGLTGDVADLLFKYATQNQVYKMHYNGSSWGAPVFVDNGTNPSVSEGQTNAKYVWTAAAASAPYEIKISAETLSKAADDSLQIAYHRSIAILDTAQGAWLEVRLDNMSIKTAKGEEWLLPFAPAKEDSSALTVGNAFSNLA